MTTAERRSVRSDLKRLQAEVVVLTENMYKAKPSTKAFLVADLELQAAEDKLADYLEKVRRG